MHCRVWLVFSPVARPDVSPPPRQVRAAADLRSLARLIPAQARLVLDHGAADGAAASVSSADDVFVATADVRRGDVLRVLPGML